LLILCLKVKNKVVARGTDQIFDDVASTCVCVFNNRLLLNTEEVLRFRKSCFRGVLPTASTSFLIKPNVDKLNMTLICEIQLFRAL
jgi:hypothetical protein